MKKIIVFILAILVVLSLVSCDKKPTQSNNGDLSFNDENSSSEQDVNTPYVITTVEELYKFAEDYNANKLPVDISVTLGADITVNNIADVYNKLTADTISTYKLWTPVKHFRGTFDGNGHTISGIVCCTETEESGTITWPSAMFAFVYEVAVVKNLTIKDSFFTSNTKNYVAAIAGKNEGIIENCTNYAHLVGISTVGGITSLNEGVINNCKNYADLYNINDNCQKGIGGIVGFNSTDEMADEVVSAKVTNCVNYGTISGCFGSSVGGIAGNSTGEISHCVNKGDIINLGNESGGIVGYSNSNGDAYGDVTNCINYADVQSERYAGGIAGAGQGVDNVYGFYNCVNYGNVTGKECGGLFTYIGDINVSGCANYGHVNAINGDNSVQASGLCVWSGENSTVENCFNGGDVTALHTASGICQRLSGTFTNCYSAGTVTSQTKGAFGITTEAYYGKIQNCYFIGEISGDKTSNYLIKEDIGYDYSEHGFVFGSCQYDKSLATDQSWYNGFDFETVWTMDTSAEYPYPTLRNMPEDTAK